MANLGKTRAFRTNDKTEEIIKRYMKENKIKKPTKAINELIEKGEGVLLLKGEASGIIVSCPLRPLPFPHDSKDPFLILDLPVDSSVCRTCKGYPCDAWGHIKSWKKISPVTSIV